MLNKDSVAKYRAANPEKVKEQKRKYYTNNPVKVMCGAFLSSIRKKTPDTDIDLEFINELISSGVCAVSGIPFDYSRGNQRRNPMRPSIDRIDSSIGYYKRNVQCILSCLNAMKNDMTQDEFLRILRMLKNA